VRRKSGARGLNLQAKQREILPHYLRLVETIKEKPCAASSRFLTQEVQFIAKEDSLSYAEITALRDAGVGSMPEQQLRSWMIGCGASSVQRRLIQRLGWKLWYGASAGFADDQHNALWSY